MNLIVDYFNSLVILTSEMAPYLLLGFFFAGLLNVYLSSQKMLAYFGGTKLKHVFNASLMGVPLPLCSCGVIPTGVSMYKNGASKASSVSFLISTPQTGVDSVLATWSLIGLPFAIVRPLVALFSGVLGGLLSSKLDNEQFDKKIIRPVDVKILSKRKKISRVFYYGFVEFMADIAKWLVVGLLLAALISVLIPDGFFLKYVQNDVVGMLILLVAAVPLYVCATGSVPIVAVLIMKGISPGAALVFLMAGPATNIASLTVLSKVLGKRSLVAYMIAIVGSSLLFGFLIDQFLPREWFTASVDHVHHVHHLIPAIVGYVSAGILAVLLFYALGRSVVRKYSNKIIKNKEDSKMTRIKVEGMTCNHCKMNVEKALMSLQGIKDVQIDLNTGVVKIEGELNEDEIREALNGIGYRYMGFIV